MTSHEMHRCNESPSQTWAESCMQMQSLLGAKTKVGPFKVAAVMYGKKCTCRMLLDCRGPLLESGAPILSPAAFLLPAHTLSAFLPHTPIFACYCHQRWHKLLLEHSCTSDITHFCISRSKKGQLCQKTSVHLASSIRIL